MYKYTHIYICVYIYAHIRMCIYVCICISTDMYICIHVYTYIYVYIYIHICIYAHLVLKWDSLFSLPPQSVKPKFPGWINPLLGVQPSWWPQHGPQQATKMHEGPKHQGCVARSIHLPNYPRLAERTVHRFLVYVSPGRVAC